MRRQANLQITAQCPLLAHSGHCAIYSVSSSAREAPIELARRGGPRSPIRIGSMESCLVQSSLGCIISHACAKEEPYKGILDELLGGGQRQKEYRDFIDRYEQGHPSEGYSDQEVLKRYADVSHAVPPNQYTQAAIEALGKLSPEERAAFVKRDLLMKLNAVAAAFSLGLTIAVGPGADATASDRRSPRETQLAQVRPEAGDATADNLRGIGLTRSHKRIIFDPIESEQTQPV